MSAWAAAAETSFCKPRCEQLGNGRASGVMLGVITPYSKQAALERSDAWLHDSLGIETCHLGLSCSAW